MNQTNISVEQAAKLCASIADEKKASDILVLDIKEVFSIADYFVICTCASKPQVRAVASEIDKKLKEAGFRHLGVEGKEDASWMLVDFGVIVVHIFLPETREFYQVEMLWGDARRLDWAKAAS